MDSGEREGARIRRYAGLFEFDHFFVYVDGIGVFWGMTMLFDTKYVFIFLAVLTFTITVVLFLCVEEVRMRFKKFRLKN